MMQTVFIKWALLGFMLSSMITLCASATTAAPTTAAAAPTTAAPTTAAPTTSSGSVTTAAGSSETTDARGRPSNYGHVSASFLIISFLMMVLVIII